MKKRVAIISASWHEKIVGTCRQSCLDELKARSFEMSDVELFSVPGSLEIPFMAQRLAETGRYAVILAIGLVVNGGIYRHDFVGAAVVNGIVQVSLKTGVPVLSAVLTPHNFHEHEAHETFFIEHMKVKGAELAGACMAMLMSLEKVDQLEKA